MSQERAAYYERAKSWAEDQHAALHVALSHARWFAAAAALVAVLEALALLLLTPLKTATPIPVLVDRETGYVQVLKADGGKDLTANEALVHSLLAQYVIARESFNITNLRDAYHKVALWSGNGARLDYLSLMPADNPQSPLRRYPRSTIVETEIKSVSPIGPQASLVRFETRRRDESGQISPPQAWVATIAYRFVDAPMSVADRLQNPLGFQVFRYHRDAETMDTLEDAQPVPASTSPSANSAAASVAASTSASTSDAARTPGLARP